MKSLNRFSLTRLLTLALLALIAGSAPAGTIIKTNNTTALNAGGSWVGGVVPGAGDTAQWDSTVTAANSSALGGSLTWGQILISNPGGAITIANTASTTLTLNGLGSPLTGIDMSSATTNLTISEAIALGASQTWNVGAARTLSISSVISSGFGITKSGSGTLSLSGANTFTGPLAINSGALNVTTMNTVANANPLGKSTAAAGNLLLGNGTTLQIAGSGSTTRTTDRLFTINGTANGDSATLDFSNDGSSAFGNGPATFTGTGALAYGTADQTRTLNLTGTCTYVGSLAAAIGDNGAGAVSVTKNGVGVVALTGNNTYSGGATVNSGVLSIGKTQSKGSGTVTAGAAGAVTLGVGTGGYTTANVDSLIANSLAGFSLDPASGAGIDTTIGAVSYVLPNSGTRPFVKVGGNTLTLTNISTYGGPVVIYSGTLAVTNLANGGSASPLGQSSSAAGNLVFNGGALQFIGTADASTDRAFTIYTNGASFTASGTNAALIWNGGPAYDVANVARTLNLVGISAGNVTNIFGGLITNNGTGAVTLNKSGLNTWWVTNGNNSFTGGVNFNSGFLQFSSGALGTGGTIQVSANSVPPLGLRWAPGNSDDISSRFTGTGSSGFCTLDTGTNDVVFASAISMHTSSWLIKAGTGSLTLNTASSWGNSVNGATLINSGALVAKVLANGGTASSIGNIPNTALALGLRGGTLKYIGTGSTNDHNFHLSGDNTIDASGSGPLVFSQTGAISPTPAARVFGLTLNSKTTGNSPSSSADLIPGMVVSAAGLPAGTKIVSIGINGSLTFDQNATVTASQTITFGSYLPGGLTLTGTSTAANEIKGILQDSVSAIDASVVTRSLTKTGVGKWILSGANTYSGPTTISAGTLALSGSGLITNSPSIVVASNAVFDVSGLGSAFTLAQSLSSQTLSNSAPGAIINGTNNCSAGTLSLVYDGVNPSFTQTGGGLTLSPSTIIKINNTGAPLTTGAYVLIANASGGLVAGSVTNSSVIVDGNGAVASATLAVSANNLVLQVGAAVPPTQLAVTSVNGGNNPYAGASFNVVVQAQDETSAAQSVVSNTVVSLAINTGNSAYLNTPLTGTIAAGTSSVTISNVIYSQPGTGISLTATSISGDGLTAGNSAAFNVLANTNKSLLTFTFPVYGAATIVGTNVSITVPAGTAVTSLAPTYTVSATATGSPVSGTALNFTTPQTYTVTAQDGSQQPYLVTVNIGAALAFFWTNTVSGSWSGAGNWTNNFGWTGAPTNTGAASYTLSFNQPGTYAATNDLNNGFLLNQFNFGGPTLTLAGNGVVLTNNGLTLPQMNQNSSASITISNNLTLGTNVTIGGTGSGAVTLNGLISGAGSLTKTNGGTLTFNNITNSYRGGTVLNAGTVTHPNFNGATNLCFGTGPVTFNNNATYSLNRTVLTNQLIFNGGTLTGGGGWGSVLSGGLITLQATPSINLSYGLNINNNITGPGGLSFGGNTTFVLAGSNNFTGPVSINVGTVSVASLNSVSGGKATSNLGAPTSATNGTISLGSTTTAAGLIYTGPGETTDRIIQLSGTTGGVTITQAGTAAGLPVTQTGQSGLLKFTNNLSIPGTAGADNRKTLILTNLANASGPGYTGGQGEIAGNIGDSVLGNAGQLATSLTKAGNGIWTLSGSNSYSGTTTIQAGTLICTKAVSLGSGPLVIIDSDISSQLELDYVGSRTVASLTLNGVSQPSGSYGSSSSYATTKDDVHFAGPGVVVVGAVSGATTNTLALTGGSNPSSGGASVTFTATVTGGNSPSGSVVFYDGLTVLGTNTLNGSAQASFSTSILTGGAHSLTALYLGNSSNAPSSSAALTQTVNDSRPATSVALALTAGSNPSSLGAAVTYTATVTGATPTGSVVFYKGTSAIGSSVVSAGQASLVVNNLPSGWNGISASYLGDANNAPSTSATTWQTVKPPAGNGKLKVFILAGQSNMQGKGNVEMGRDPNNVNGASIAGGLGTLRNMLNGNPNKYGYLVDTNAYANTTNTTVPGWRTLTNVWVSYFTTTVKAPNNADLASTNEMRKGYLDADFGNYSRQGQIGPEYGFGLVVGSQLGDPVLIIKTAWGGNSLGGDFCPPSSGTNIQPTASLATTVGAAYSNMVASVRLILNNLTNELSNFDYNPTNGYEIAGFGWHQGWNDIGEPQQQYETNLVNLINDLRADFGVPNLPVAIGITGMASASGNQLKICAAQAAAANPVLHPELAGTVVTVDTRPFDYGFLLGVNNQGYHWYFNGQSQFEVGQSMGLAMMQLLSAKAAVTNNAATSVTTNSAALNASVTWPFTPCSGVAYWDTIDRGTNAAAWANSAVVNSWTNFTTTYQYGVAGDYVLAGGAMPTLAATNLSFAAPGLTPNTTYYFTFAATNRTVSSQSLTNVQVLWAPSSLSFTTLTASVPLSPPTLSGFGPLTGTSFPLTFSGPNGQTYSVLASTNVALPLASWSVLTTGTFGASPVTFTDTGATNTQRFYIIRSP